LNALNTRLDAEGHRFYAQSRRGEGLLTDREFSPTIAAALRQVDRAVLVIDIDDALSSGGDFLGETEYEAFLETGDAAFAWRYRTTNGTRLRCRTHRHDRQSRGVVTHHRGAYLNAVRNIVTWAMPHFPVYLWTLPMFHCNGWCFPGRSLRSRRQCLLAQGRSEARVRPDPPAR
jgi:fatty-acyl-CoA synthase